MSSLTLDGQRLVAELSSRYGISADAVTTMMVAVSNGGGTMAQFYHPELGGGGQWMAGGMTMTGDMFNHGLKALVSNLCSDIAAGMTSGTLLFKPNPDQNWWPKELGPPSATGSQNQMRYAYFPAAKRLAIRSGGSTWVYDTAEHQIGGFAQQQGSNTGITLSSQFGTVPVSQLQVVWRGQGEYREETPRPAATSQPGSGSEQPTSESQAAASSTSESSGMSEPNPMSDAAASSDPLAMLERLANLKERGLISDEEFSAKKADLLARI